MTPATLRRHIGQLREAGPISTALAKALMRGRKPRRTWYKDNQKKHWLVWLGPNSSRSHQRQPARFFYNQIRSAPMLLWLGEASGVSVILLKKAAKAARSAGKAGSAAQCAAIRRMIPWSDIASRLGRC
jgi:hypothetical protein